MILIWFNPNNQLLYAKFYKHYIENKYFLGYRNSYDHEVVQIIIITSDNKIYSVYDYLDYYIRSRDSTKKNKKLINSIRNLLDKI